MKILIDIGHPAHVHYFKNLIRIMGDRGHEFLITARDRRHVFELLAANGIDYVSRGKGASGRIGKLAKMPLISWRVFDAARRFGPDLFLSFASMYAAQAAALLRRPHIVFDDTENAMIGRFFYVPFSDVVCTPSCFRKSVGAKQLEFDSYMELSYLHPRYFKPDARSLEGLGLSRGEQFFIIRLVAWEASHDAGHAGIDQRELLPLITELEGSGKVYISSEKPLTGSLKKYELQIPAEDLHDLLYFATLCITEGATVASECGLLGTPAIYVNSEELGYLAELENRYGMISCLKGGEGLTEQVRALLATGISRHSKQPDRERLLAEKIDTTAFMVWLIENFPQSRDMARANPARLGQFLAVGR